MDLQEHLGELARKLADLYPQQDQSLRLVRESGISEYLVNYRSSAIDNWNEIVQQANKQSRLANLVAVARKDYPEDFGLTSVERELNGRSAFPASKVNADNISVPQEGASQVVALAHGLATLGKSPRILISELQSGNLEWRGAIGPDRIGDLWIGKSNFQIAYAPSLFKHWEVSAAILRLALHGSGGILFVREPDRWMEQTAHFVGHCIGTTWDRKSPSLAGPTEQQWGLQDFTRYSGAPIDGVQSVAYLPAELARLIHNQLDAWVLNDLGERIVAILQHQKTADFSFKLEEELAKEMWNAWTKWRDALHASTDLRRHFMQVMLTTAMKDQSRIGHARLGPRTIRRCLVHSIVFALAVTVGLPREFQPAKGDHYENLEVAPSGKGHLCGLELIETVDFSAKIQDLIWRTDCVLLPHYDGPGDEIASLTKNFRESGGGSHRFDKPSVYSPLFFTNETAFRRALGHGITALRPYLLGVVQRWDMRQQAELNEATETDHDASQSK